MDANDAVARALKSYAQHARDWKFLGYSEPLVLAILTEFYGLGKVRNPSPKPLNVLAMVGKRRVVAIRDALAEQQAARSDSAPDVTPEGGEEGMESD